MSAKDIPLVIVPEDEYTVVGYNFLEEHGFGSRPTIWRKVKTKSFPCPFAEGKWTLAQIKRYLSEKLARAAAP